MLFRLYDVDSSGFITPSDVKIALTGIGDTDKSDRIDQIVGQYWDRDGDGKVSYEEFLKRQV